MKEKHLRIRIEQCLALARASSCPLGQHAAQLIDPGRNVVLMDSYNGAPRGGGRYCGGAWCHRQGLRASDIELSRESDHRWWLVHTGIEDPQDRRLAGPFLNKKHAAAKGLQELLSRFPPIPGEEKVEIGCHHTVMNLICNAAANGVRCQDAWLITTGGVCLMCAKLIHHAGIQRVMIVQISVPPSASTDYLVNHSVHVDHIQPPHTEDASGPPGASGLATHKIT